MPPPQAFFTWALKIEHGSPCLQHKSIHASLQGSHLAAFNLQSHLTRKVYVSDGYEQGVNIIRLQLLPTGCDLQTISLRTFSFPTWSDSCSVVFSWDPRVVSDAPIGSLWCIIWKHWLISKDHFSECNIPDLLLLSPCLSLYSQISAFLCCPAMTNSLGNWSTCYRHCLHLVQILTTCL